MTADSHVCRVRIVPMSSLQLRYLLIVSVFVLAAAGNAAAQGAFTLTSTTFKDGQMMPRKVSNMNPQNPNCVGENVSPQLSWSNPPEGTKSFAILMEDPEARGGAGVHHWVAYGIPPTVTSFAEGDARSKMEPPSGLGDRKSVKASEIPLLHIQELR